jgi:hypothetical protein
VITATEIDGTGQDLLAFKLTSDLKAFAFSIHKKL